MIPRHISNDGWALIASVVIVSLYWSIEKYWHSHRRVRSQYWNLKFGQVSKATVFQGNHESILTLWYSYPVADEPHPIPAEFQKAFASIEEAQRWADALCNTAIPVHVNPTNSWKSELWDSDLEPIVMAATSQ